MLINWAGSEELFSKYEGIAKQIAEASPEMIKMAQDWEEEQDTQEEHHWMLEMYGDVAVVNVKGILVEGTTGWWGEWMGICGYDDIRNAVVTGVNNGAKAIALYITSPGGIVVGIGACSDFLKEVDKLVPVHMFTDTYAASGGVWLAVTTGRFQASRHAEVGSVGVLQVTSEYTKMFNEMGITKRVFKSTELKATGNVNEKLSAAGAAEIERSIGESAKRFVDHIAMSMGLSTQYVEDNIHTGQMWYAEDALKLGLINGMTSFDKLLVDLQKKVSQNNTNSAGSEPAQPFFNTNAEADMASKKQITKTPEEELALAASGVITLEAAVETPATEGEDASTEVAPAEQASTEAPAAEASPAPAESVTLIASLNSQLIAAGVELAQVKLDVTAKTEALEKAAADIDLLKQVVCKNIGFAKVGAGGSAPSVESLMALSASELVTQYTEARAELEKRVGGGGRHSAEDQIGDAEEDKVAASIVQSMNEWLPSVRIGSAK
jgi:capsid assembly protease